MLESFLPDAQARQLRPATLHYYRLQLGIYARPTLFFLPVETW